jgi:hypothetical protein
MVDGYYLNFDDGDYSLCSVFFPDAIAWWKNLKDIEEFLNDPTCSETPLCGTIKSSGVIKKMEISFTDI